MDPVEPDQKLQLDALGVDVKVAEQREIITAAEAEIAKLQHQRLRLFFDFHSKAV